MNRYIVTMVWGSQWIKWAHRDVPGSPVVGTSPANRGGCRFNPRSGSEDPLCLEAKTLKHKKNSSNIVTNLIKTLEMVPNKKTF